MVAVVVAVVVVVVVVVVSGSTGSTRLALLLTPIANGANERQGIVLSGTA